MPRADVAFRSSDRMLHLIVLKRQLLGISVRIVKLEAA
jgi:hypothetical protein